MFGQHGGGRFLLKAKVSLLVCSVTSPWICPLCPQQLCSTVTSPLWCGVWFGHQSLSASWLCAFSSLCHEMCVGQEVPLLSRCARCVSRVELSYLIPQFLLSLLCWGKASCLHCAGGTLGSFLPVLRIQLLVSSLAEALSRLGVLWDL